jgi:mRNA interferase MazF
VVARQGDIWWSDIRPPIGSEPGYPRPVLVVQSDSLNRSRIATIMCVPLTGNLRWGEAPGNVLLDTSATGLGRDSVANVSQIMTLDRTMLAERVGTLPEAKLDLVLYGIDVVLSKV